MKPCWVNYIFMAIVIGLGTLSMVSACGQKGDLVLPDETTTTAYKAQ